MILRSPAALTSSRREFAAHLVWYRCLPVWRDSSRESSVILRFANHTAAFIIQPTKLMYDQLAVGRQAFVFAPRT